MIYQLEDRRVRAAEDCFVADCATVIGTVALHEGVSVWFGAVIRGDNEPITVGRHSNVQDGAVLHTDAEFPCVVGEGVTIGHKAVVHGCRIDNNSLIGINAVILNGAVIGRNCLIGANALVTEGKHIPDNSLVLGSPGKVVKTLSKEEIEELTASALRYLNNGRRYRAHLKGQTETDALE
ncbi:MAG: gamma carbonic anhydrase family protein [Proteobacteria bacterium]|nr:gamma carbonic anhydrase family protein [Pseudomonadota bacterium]